MAKLTNFFKIVSPQTAASETLMKDNQFLGNSVAASQSTWYYTLMAGSSNRLGRYTSYDIMDSDVDVNRALNIIAENMTSFNNSTNLPIDLDITKDDSQKTDDTLALTLNAALKKWSEIHGFDQNRLFKIARTMIKYGDCFFKKTDKLGKWEYIPPNAVIGAIVNANNISEIVGYQVRTNIRQASNNTQFSSLSNMNNNNQNVELLDAKDVVRFSILDDMSDAFPFGNSVLSTTFKVYKQVQLLEDCMVIFRLGRSTSKRLFTIPAKNMNPARSKQLLDTFKREISQRLIPSSNANGDSLDSVYNPQSILDDIFILQQCLSLDTHINVVGIGAISLFEIIHRFKRGQKLAVYTVDQDTGEFSTNYINWAGITKHDAEIIKLYFSNDTFLECTPDHKMIKYDLKECLAENLQIGDRLISHDFEEIILEKVEIVSERITVGCLTVDTLKNNHNFQLESGIFVRNSDGQKVEVQKLDGDPNLGEMTDLSYLQKKLFRSLFIPYSYMLDNENRALFSDGKTGSAYIEETIFYNFVDRLQVYVEDILTKEFKKFLFNCNINVDQSLFKLKLPKTSNYKIFQKNEMDSSLLSTASSADAIPYLSKRFILSNYLQLSEAEILENEQLLKQEKGLGDNVDKSLQKLYGSAEEMGAMGGSMGGFGADMGMGGMPMDQGLGGEMGMPTEEPMGAEAPPSAPTPPPV